MRDARAERLYVFMSLLLGALAQNSLHKHDISKRHLDYISEPTIVYPRRNSVNLKPSHKHFQKRSIRDILDANVDYSLEFNGKSLNLSLQQFDDFYVEGFEVQRFRENYTWIERADVNSGLGCLYKGSVGVSEWSQTTVSLCGGMTGTIHFGGEHYFIEPVKLGDNISDISATDTDSVIPHKLYSLNHSHKHFNNGGSKHCAVNSENYKHKRRKRSLDMDIDSTYSNDSNSSSSSSLSTGVHHLSKRSVAYRNFVEVMVAADSTMLHYHGDNLQHYILSLMAIVNSIYRNHTIQNFIHVVVVKIIVFESDKEGPKITENAGDSLKRFCRWQSKNNEADGSRNHYDTAILLTRMDICRAPDKCDTLGLAELGTMCDPERSCSIIEDNGISASYTIAHELGHIFNLPHDDDNRCKKPAYKRDPQAKTHIMSPTIDEYTDPWSWSDCSSRLLTKFLDAGAGNCLHNVPKIKKYRKHIKRIQKQQVGSLYNADKQCELAYGKNFRVCPFQKTCPILWCTEDINRGCRTQHMPMTDGTKCGQGKWCMKGQCVRAKHDKKVKGGWGKWKPYGKCTRTCGGGIKRATRDCNNPEPRGGGRYCSGKRVKYRHCNTKSCPTNSEDFRVQQCAEYNSQIRLYNITPGSKWIPKYDGIQEKDWCKLYCKADSSPSHFYMLNHKVVDGTKCRPDSDDICVNGQCRRGGCDNKLGSNMKRDRCGVCGGDNASCQTISDTYNTVSYGYNNVSLIPAGATNIDIRQRGYNHLKDDENYLAIVNSRNEYLLNGDFIISMYPQRIEILGGALEYTGSETIEERINSTGTLGEPLLIQVLSVGNLKPPKIHFSYTMSLLQNDIQFEWREDLEWTECNDICNGVRYRKVKCVRNIDKSEVSAQRCENQPKPYTQRERCNLFCTVSWRINRDECSALCGPGTAKQYISCTLTTRYNASTVDVAHCEKRTRDIGPRPAEMVPCQGKCLETHWLFSPWTECTVTCDGGAQKRSAKCVDSQDNPVADNHCNEKEHILERACNMQPCTAWRAHDWTGCSVTCGNGSRHRKVVCYQGDQEVIDTRCDYKQKPTSKLDCYMGPCPRWTTGEWGECSTTCDMGIAIRGIQCQTLSGKELDDFHCDATLRPYETKHCNLGICPTTTISTSTTRQPTTIPVSFTWSTGSWTQCSTSCGEGIKQRYVTCMSSRGDVVDIFECNQLTKPSETEACTPRACGYWRTGDWGKCSATCGPGVQSRFVACTLIDRKPADEIQCDIDVKPETERSCNLKDCEPEELDIGKIVTNTVVGIMHWRVGPWSACSATCGTGWERRQVLCHDENGPSSRCVEDEKPETRRTCDAGPCPRWVKGEWSQCSKSCGEMGMQKRTVQCQSVEGKSLPEANCDIFKRPPDSGMCNNGPCSNSKHWQLGPWSSCSVTCGMGVSQRDVLCVAETGMVLSSTECDSPKPRNTRRCSLHACPSWAHTRWGKCSTTCGKGIQSRQVVCRIGTGEVVPSELCLRTKRPRQDRVCNPRPCEDYMWTTGNWSKCTKECGFGHKMRDTHCTDVKDNHVNESLCNLDKKPKVQRRCSEFPCPFMWNTSPWSECSQTCGNGSQTRRVACQGVTKEGWILPGEVPYGCKHQGKPNETQACNYGPCNSRYHWLTAPWGECSTRCGHGYRRRQVQCIDVTGQRRKKKLCSKEHRPSGRQLCYNGPCYSHSCAQLREQTSIRQDGSYKLFIQGRLIEIFCRNMKRSLPEEFLTLTAGESENFSEMYPFRLKRQKTCPLNGTRPEPCNSTLCREREYRNSGKSFYNKVKIDIRTLKILTTDETFSRSINGKHIPYGTAGDCYSSATCPQGRFKINLSGTGLLVAPNTTWVPQGNNASARVEFLQDGEIVEGICGGSCGWCTPEGGIQLQVLT